MLTINKVTIIGQGYVGLNLAIEASKHYKVIGYDTSPSKIKHLNEGNSYIEDVSNQRLQEAIRSSNFIPSIDEKDLANSDVYIICVPTPLDENRKPDLSFLHAACDLISKSITKPSLIINESTSFPGTLRELIMERIQEKSSFKNFYAVAPERVDPGRMDFNLKNTPRLIGGINQEATNLALQFYGSFCDNLVPLSSPEIAETAKLFENTFRQVNIALVNELAIICKSLNLDTFEVIEAASTKPYGFMKFLPGPGVGGHCIPVDPTYLAYSANKKGVSARFIELANAVNLEMPTFIVENCYELLNGLKDKRVLIAGVTYKSNISDVRESPAYLLRERLLEEGAIVYWFDPLVASWESNQISNLTNEQFDLCILQVLHDEMDVQMLQKCSKVLFDCTGIVEGTHSI